MSELLRIATAGSVDDGKSTLIGRLLYDSKAIFEDQLDAVSATSRARGSEAPDLALVTDGLRAEREQGITIDVAYRYFATPACLPCNAARESALGGLHQQDGPRRLRRGCLSGDPH